MARMVPPYFPEEIKSSGEKQFFDLLRHDPATVDWVCLHSLSLARHVNRVYGEIDFVVLIPNEGIFCLEIKSGRVARQEGVWRYTNRYGDVSTSTIGPFRQVRDGMFSLLEAVRRHFGRQHRYTKLLYGFGVVFPHISFVQEDSEIESWQIYDRNSRRQPVSRFLRNLSINTRRNVESQRWYDEEESRPSLSDILKLLDFLRGDFERIVKPADLMIDTEEQILRLTEEQYRCLDQLQDNPRCLFDGGAGTGKTLLALEYARREATSGKRVFLVCFNRLLGQWLASQRGASLSPSIEVDYFHHFLDRIIADSSLRNEFRRAKRTEDQDYLFGELYPLFALDALSEDFVESYDTLIVDEGQDLIRSEYLDVFDGLINGGLAGGTWAIFCDFFHQTIYGKIDENEMLCELEKRSQQFIRFRLLTNCRNTRPIGEEVSFISGFAIPPFLPATVEGVPVNYGFYKDDIEQCSQINDIVDQLRAEGIKSESITILSPATLEHSCLVKRDRISFKVRDLTRSGLQKRIRNVIGFSTIHAFKGLESSVIIIADVSHLLDDRNRALLYVGMSRARFRLFVLISDSARDEYREAIRRSLQKGTG